MESGVSDQAEGTASTVKRKAAEKEARKEKLKQQRTQETQDMVQGAVKGVLAAGLGGLGAGAPSSEAIALQERHAAAAEMEAKSARTSSLSSMANMFMTQKNNGALTQAQADDVDLFFNQTMASARAMMEL